MEDESEVQEEVPSVKELRDAADRGRKATQELDGVRREMAFLKAGIDTDTKAGQLLLRAYDGELTVEAIKTEADELGLFKAPAVPTAVAQETRATDEAASAERQALTDNSVPPGTTTESPYDAGHRAFKEMIDEGRPQADSAARFVHTVLEAAGGANPDDRVLND